jgi:hypothetical protein
MFYQQIKIGEMKMSNWKSDLASFFNDKEQEIKMEEEKMTDTKIEVAKFYSAVVVPAFEELKAELEKYQREVRISSSTESASIIVSYKGETEFDYSIKVRIHPGKAFPYPETRFRDPSDGKNYLAEGFLGRGIQNYTTSQIDKDEIIQNFLSDYKSHMHHS